LHAYGDYLLGFNNTRKDLSKMVIECDYYGIICIQAVVKLTEFEMGEKVGRWL